jgi:PadR family transcriptional regulator, regulatory protein PadR
MTDPTRRVLRALLEASPDPTYGFGLAQRTGIAGGTLYPMLLRLEKLGWLQAEWEGINASQAGRPRRRYYQLTIRGVEAAQAVLQQHEELWPRRAVRLRSEVEALATA